MRRALVLAAALLLGACESELNHALNYDDVRRDPSAQASASQDAAAPPAAIVTPPITTPPGAVAPPAKIIAAPPPAPVPVPAAAESPGMGFCKAAATGEAAAGAFDDATRRNVYARSLAQCLALHGN